MASAVIELKLKCGRTLASITWISLVRLPERISLSLVMRSTTSVVTFFTSTSGGTSCACALARTPPRRPPRIMFRIVFIGLLTRQRPYGLLPLGLRGGLRGGFRGGFLRGLFGRHLRLLVALARLARRVAVVDLAAAALQVRVALEHVLVERGLLEDPARVEEVGAPVHETQSVRRIAHRDGPEIGHRVAGEDVDSPSHGVAQRARAEDRQDDVGAVAHAPAPERLAEILVALLDAHVGGDVVQAEQAERAVEDEAHPVLEAVEELALQHVVDPDPQVAEVGEEVADAAANLFVQDVAVGSSHRHCHPLVRHLVEAVDGAVHRLQRVARVAVLGGGAAARQRQQQRQHAQGQAQRARQRHFFSSLPSAALLKRNWLIRFSSTTADWVRRTRSPFFSITPSPPASRPMYCSPRMPEVRIFAVLSRGNR